MRTKTRVEGMVIGCAIAAATGHGVAHAQGLGTLTWQLQPYCNVVVLTVTQNGALYTLDGFDTQCGAATRAPAVGLATASPNGSIAFGLTITTPSGAAVQVDATATLPTGNGTWRDSAGHSGTFAFAASTGGNPRPPVAPGSPGTATTYTAPQTFSGGISVGGTTIANVGTPTVATDAATKGYVDAAVPTPSQFTFQADGGFVARGQDGVGTIPATGAGPRLMWYPAKRAFRAGLANSVQWDDVNVGLSSMAMGEDTIASGMRSTALGQATTASGLGSTAMGVLTSATGQFSTALGVLTSASGTLSTALGTSTRAAGLSSMAFGQGSVAEGDYSIVVGNQARTSASGDGSFVFGDSSTNTLVTSNLPNEFLVRASGGTAFFSNPAGTSGVRLAPGAGAWTNVSDAARKQTFRDVNGELLLGKLRAMPIREWSYIAQGDGIRHMGPTAQDFRAAFGLGEDPLGISTIDADGIALRAIQALEARTGDLKQATSADLADLRAETVRLRAELDAIKRVLSSLSGSRR